MKGGNFAEHIFVKCPPPKKTFLTAKMAFDRCVEDFNIEHWSSPLQGHGSWLTCEVALG